MSRIYLNAKLTKPYRLQENENTSKEKAWFPSRPQVHFTTNLYKSEFKKNPSKEIDLTSAISEDKSICLDYSLDSPSDDKLSYLTISKDNLESF